MTIALGILLVLVLAALGLAVISDVQLRQGGRRPRAPMPVGRVEECEVCARPADHRLVSIIEDSPTQGGTAMAADYCAEHCPGGCRQGCATA